MGDGDELLPPITPYFVMKVGRVPHLPYRRPGSPDSAELAERAIAAYARRGVRLRAVMLARLSPNVWVDALAGGSITSLAARSAGKLIGCTAIVAEPHSWSRHVGELRVMISPDWRGRGLGRELIQENFALALGLGLEKLAVQMTVDQRAAIAVFEGLGFRAEAVLQGHVKDRDGKTHDLVLLSHHVAAVQSRQQTYGLTDALGG